MKFVTLEAESYTDQIREPDPEDRWDSGESNTSWNVVGLSLENKDSHQALPVDDSIKIGDVLYAVYVIYSTGDSFGHYGGSDIELISVHKNKELAQKNKIAIEEDKPVVLDNGETLKLYRSWDCYFNSLDSANMKGFVVT